MSDKSSSHETARREAAITAIAAIVRELAMMGVKAPSSSARSESANDCFGVETQDNPPPSPPREGAFLAFTASAPKAVHSASVRSGSAAEGNEGVFRCKIPLHRLSGDEAPSVPIGACPNGVTEGTSVAFMCSNVANAV